MGRPYEDSCEVTKKYSEICDCDVTLIPHFSDAGKDRRDRAVLRREAEVIFQAIENRASSKICFFLFPVPCLLLQNALAKVVRIKTTRRGFF